MVGIIDYGVGNLFSLQSSLKAIGQSVVVSSEPEILRKADRILLPGVGAFEDAVRKLRACGMDQMVYEAAKEGKPLMGICLGMQMLFEKSFEYGQHQGLGLLKGQVVPMEGCLPGVLKIPHMAGMHWKLPSPMANYLPIPSRESMCILSIPTLLPAVPIPWQPPRSMEKRSLQRWKETMFSAVSSTRRRVGKWV